jgi:nitrogen-specific signal transduction histidine kinase
VITDLTAQETVREK